MELIDRYLKTLKSALPDEQKEDIVREMSENIYSEIDEKERELGRPLNDDEVQSVLKRHGNPLVVASQYRQDQRSLSFGRQIIGPTLFPFYSKVLTFNLGITGIVVLIIFTALLASGQTIGFGSGLSTLFYQLLIQFSVVTLIFAAMDRRLTKYPDHWDVANPSKAHFPRLSVGCDGPTVSRIESVSQLIALTVFLIWLRAVKTAPVLVLGPAALYLKAAPIWHQMYAPIVMTTLVVMAQSLVNLIRTDWVKLRWFARVATGAANLVICVFLIKAGVWVTAKAEASAGYQHGAAITNQVILYSLLAATLVTVITLARDVRRLIGSSVSAAPRKAAVSS